MSDWLGLGLIVLIVLGALCGMAALGKPYEVTPDEFEKRVEENRGMMRSGAAAGLHALQKLMNPRAAEAVEVLKDLKAGYYDDKEEVGDDDDKSEGQEKKGEGQKEKGKSEESVS
ncbi:MAG TPA: hypothetical protein VGB73_15190 [Pyrinomonadaceae bacterium]|jgi:hypothetical protein